MTALALFFLAGAAISGVSCMALVVSGGLLEPMWRLNPRAREAFTQMGAWGVLLLAAVCTACAAAAAGLWRGKRWGHRLAAGLITANLIGDIVNVILGTEPRALIGVPIAAALLVYLATSRVRAYFHPLDA